MITPTQMVLAIRKDLATSVLPTMTDDRARSSVIAAMGILGVLARQIREDDSWLTESVRVLADGVRRWPVDPPPEVADLREYRKSLLDVSAQLITKIWRGEADSALLADVRGVLRADLDLQLKRIR
ncbi:hypothetical protein [Thermocrispum municipale]|jgi:hypothetical protein|uniref:hypothetical protein n=1 Tax=Thermocrispum municipale TaxID=37926 RepID=UPI000426EA81|nr:hypothetical protein [Thermocrispum municipale]